jgi:hypothetical protein
MTINQPTIALGYFTDENGVEYQDSYLDENGNIAMFFSINSVAQTVRNAISLWQGEYQFDTQQGIDWGNILGRVSNRLILNTFIQKQVLLVSYVTSIISIDYTFDNENRIEEVIVQYYNTDSKVGIANVNF